MNGSPQPGQGKDASMTTSRTTAPGAAAMAAASLLLLVDLAVETSWAGSPVRWWVAPLAIVFVALSVWLWKPGEQAVRRWGWGGAAAWSLGGLLVLLAVSSWMPGGQTNGVRMLLQPTAAVLTVVTAAAVVLAAFVLFRAVAGLPSTARMVARGVLVTVAVYALASLGFALHEHAPFAALFQGGAVWQRLPRWLQGSFIGAIVLLPLAILVQIARFADHLRRKEPVGILVHQATALVMACVMTLSGVTIPGGTPAPVSGRQAPAEGPAGPPSLAPGAGVSTSAPLALPPPSPPAPTLDELKARFDQLAPRIPEERFDADAQGRTLGPGVEPIFSFVRDRIRYDAYSGVLRGANGALAARAGNSFDRSLLLARMLAVHGVRTRFVRGDLPRAEADTLFGRIFEGFRPPPDFAASDAGGETDVTRFWVRVTARARRDYTVIRAALGDLLPAPALPPREQALLDIQQHVWVQADVDGKWLDLDTSFAAAKPGTTYCPARQTVGEMPPDWHQRVTMRVTEERLENGALKTTRALETTLPAVGLVDQEVFLVHVPAVSGGGGMGLGAAGAPQGADRWAPALSIGEDVKVGQPVVFGERGGESTGFFDALGGGGSSVLVAEWLDFEVLRPDGRRDVTRRTLVNRATGDWRASKEHSPTALRPLVRDDKGLVAPRAISNIWFSAGPHNLRGYADTIMELSVAGAAEPAPEASLGLQLLPLALSNFGALVWADHAAIPAVNDLPHVRLYSDSPRIVIVSVTPGAKGGMVEEFDLRRDWLCGLGRDASADALVTDRKIWYAALEGALEDETVAREKAAMHEDASAVSSTSGLLTAEGVVMIGPSDLDRLSQLVSDPEKAARIGAAIRGGNLLAAPHAALASGPGGWWEIAPGGDARAVLSDDLNGSTVLFNSWGGIKAIATRWGINVIRDPVQPKTWASRFGNRDPRPPKEKRGHALEYGMVLALVAMATLCAQKYYSSQLELRAYELSLALAAGDQWERYYRGE